MLFSCCDKIKLSEKLNDNQLQLYTLHGYQQQTSQWKDNTAHHFWKQYQPPWENLALHKQKQIVPSMCPKSNLIYQATVTFANQNASYFGSCSTSFSACCKFNRTTSFRHSEKASHSKLSKCIWLHKEKTQLTILNETSSNKLPHTNVVQKPVAFAKKLPIMQAKPGSIFNKTIWPYFKVQGKNKFLLKNVNENTPYPASSHLCF